MTVKYAFSTPIASAFQTQWRVWTQEGRQKTWHIAPLSPCYLSAMRDSGRSHREASPQGASQRRTPKRARVEVPSVDKCGNWDSAIPTTCNENSRYMFSRSTHVVRASVRQRNGGARVSIAKQERMSCATWRRIVWQNCTAALEAPAVTNTRSALMMEPAFLLLPDNTASNPPPPKKN